MATDIEAITSASDVKGSVGPKQFQGLFDVLPFKSTLTDTTQTAAKAAEVSLTVAGAALGDFVFVASAASLQGGVLSAYVSAANTVDVLIYNPEGTDAITPFAGGVVIKGVILKPKANVFENF